MKILVPISVCTLVVLTAFWQAGRRASLTVRNRQRRMPMWSFEGELFEHKNGAAVFRVR